MLIQGKSHPGRLAVLRLKVTKARGRLLDLEDTDLVIVLLVWDHSDHH